MAYQLLMACLSIAYQVSQLAVDFENKKIPSSLAYLLVLGSKITLITLSVIASTSENRLTPYQLLRQH